MRRRAHRGEVVAAACKQAEGEQQRHCPEARHDEIDVTGASVVPDPVVGHHQRPGAERHELPGQKEGEGIGGQDNQVHARQESRIEGQHPERRGFMAAIADRIKARGRTAQIDDQKEEGRKRIDPEMRAKPGQSHRQRHGAGRLGQERIECHDAGGEADNEAKAVDDRPRAGAAPYRNGQACNREQKGHRRQEHHGGHRATFQCPFRLVVQGMSPARAAPSAAPLARRSRCRLPPR